MCSRNVKRALARASNLLHYEVKNISLPGARDDRTNRIFLSMQKFIEIRAEVVGQESASQKFVSHCASLCI
jgi:hypothetical protein